MSLELISTGDAPAIKVGRDAGWILSFHQENRDGIVLEPVFEISRDDYFADISASLPSGLDGGAYTFVIEGLTDDDYTQISQKIDDAPSVMSLYLYWRDFDVGDAGIVSNLIGSDFINGFQKTSKISKHAKNLVATLRIVSVTRKAGARKYETTITAREYVFDQLQKRRPCGETIVLKDRAAALKELMSRAATFPGAEVPYKFHEITRRPKPPSADAEPEDDVEEKVDARQPISSAILNVAKRLEEDANRHGRGMLLIRDGTLHVGQRPIPFEGKGKPSRPLTLDQGLLEVEALQREDIDPNWDYCDENNKDKPPPSRMGYRLTLRGRADLKPGDMVVFDAPSGEEKSTKSPLGGAFGALGDLAAGTVAMFTGSAKMKSPIDLYVAAVEHKLGRTTGFTTKVTGVEIKGKTDDNIWDAHTLADPQQQTEKSAGSPKGTVEQEAADAVVRLFRREIGKLGATDVAEVRSFQVKSEGAKPGQTSALFRGVTPVVGPGASHRADIKRPTDSEASSVPYLTPFAWGLCGLVLPRYPGMRVALNHSHFDNGDPIDIGAMWQRGRGPENAEAGDWWLSLPADKPDGNAPEKNKVGPPKDYEGAVTNDLTDSEGNRVIEVGAMIVRVGSANLGGAGLRPNKPKADSVTIEFPAANDKEAWRLQIDKDGTVSVQGKQITIRATEKLTLDAPSVVVKCDTMDVQ